MKNTKKRKIINIVLNIFLVAIFLVSLTLVSFKIRYVNIVVSGSSMNPNIDNLEVGYMKRVRKATKIERFDIVAVDVGQDATGNETYWIKRVLGLPNEQISLINDILYVDGNIVEETFDYLKKDEVKTFNYTLGENEYLIYGDNRKTSVDPKVVSFSQFIGKDGFLTGTCVAGCYNYSTGKCSKVERHKWKYLSSL